MLQTTVASILKQHLEKHNLISTRQFGFRQMSTANLKLLLSTEWNATLDRRKDAFVIALDIGGAFDKVWHVALAIKLHTASVDGSLLKLPENFLRDKDFKVAVGG